MTEPSNIASQRRILSQRPVPLLQTPVSTYVEALRISYLSDGLSVIGFIVKPKEVRSKAPLLIYNRGGSEGRGLINEFILSWFLAMWASKGYVVLASQYRGNDGGEGQDEFGGSDINDVMNLVHVAHELPYVDTDRKFMMGHSRGGMMTYLAIRNGIDVKAAAVVSGLADFVDGYHKREQRMKDICEKLVGHPSTHREKYIERSATYWADDICVPIMIVHGAKDMNVPVEQVRDLVNKLRERNKDYTYIEYPDGHHALRSYGAEYQTKIVEFFSSHA